MEGASQTHAAAAAQAQATARRVHGARPREPDTTPYVGLVTRAIAFAVDAALINLVAILVGVVVALVLSLLPASQHRDTVLAVVGAAAFALWTIGYFVAFWTTTGQTPGNRALQIKVVRSDGSHLLPRHAITRLFGVVLSIPLLLGFVPILFTERRRALYDWLAGTVVIAAPREDASRA
jgi:uncharacterized RDD family membrane protein YckC